MILLSRYLLVQFAVNFITVASGFISIYLLIDFFEKIDNFTAHGKPFGLAMKFFLLNIPFIIDQLGPVLILLSGVITLGILYHNNELRALTAGGVPFFTIIRPIVLGSVIATTLFLGMAQWLLPRTIATTNQIWHEELQGKVPLGINRGGRYYYKGQEGFYSFEWPEPEKLIFNNFSYSCWNEAYNLRLLLSAAEAQWENGVWIFRNGQIQRRMDDGQFQHQSFETIEDRLPESPELFFIPEYKSAEMSLTELFLDAHRGTSVEETTRAWANFSSRLSYIFLGIPLLILGMPILIYSYQKWGRDLSVAIPASCGLAFFAWGVWGALQSLAKAGYMSIPLSAIIIHVLFASLGMALLWKHNR